MSVSQNCRLSFLHDSKLMRESVVLYRSARPRIEVYFHKYNLPSLGWIVRIRLGEKSSRFTYDLIGLLKPFIMAFKDFDTHFVTLHWCGNISFLCQHSKVSCVQLILVARACMADHVQQ